MARIPKMPKHLNLLIIEGLKTVGMADCLGYIEERLTEDEHEKVKNFLAYVQKNNLTIGWGNIDALWFTASHVKEAAEKRKEQPKARPKTRYALDMTSTYYVYANSEEEARQMWADTNFGEAENLDITEVRIAS